MTIKKVVFFTIICMGLFSVALAGGYQGAKWGMSPAEVQAAFPDMTWKASKAKRGYCYFLDELLKLKVMKMFMFNQEKQLYRVEIVPKPTMSSALGSSGALGVDPHGIKVYSIFKQLQAAMKKKYGEPAKSGCTNNSKIVDIMEAVIIGGAECHDIWELEDSIITLQAKRQFTSSTDSASVWFALLAYETKGESAPTAPAPDIEDEI